MAVAERQVRSTKTQSAASQSALGRASQSEFCPACEGTGAVTFWNEVAYFEDRRRCTRCDAGKHFEERLADIIDRAVVVPPSGMRR